MGASEVSNNEKRSSEGFGNEFQSNKQGGLSQEWQTQMAIWFLETKKPPKADNGAEGRNIT